MKKLFYFIIILIFGACSVTTEETEDNTNYGTNEGTASSPVELTVGTAKSGSVGRSGYSYYKFTTSSGAGNYKLAMSSMSITDSYSVLLLCIPIFTQTQVTQPQVDGILNHV